MPSLTQFTKGIKSQRFRTLFRKQIHDTEELTGNLNRLKAAQAAERVFPWLNDLEHQWCETGLPTKNQQAILDQLWESMNLLWDYCGVNER